MKYQGYRDLAIYQLAEKLAVEIHEMPMTLPSFEMYEEGAQIRRSSKSVKSTTVGGFGRRRYKADFIRFLVYALASCDETRDHMSTLYKTKSPADAELYGYFCEQYLIFGKKIRAFINSVERSHKTQRRIPQGSGIEDQVSRQV